MRAGVREEPCLEVVAFGALAAILVAVRSSAGGARAFVAPTATVWRHHDGGSDRVAMHLPTRRLPRLAAAPLSRGAPGPGGDWRDGGGGVAEARTAADGADGGGGG